MKKATRESQQERMDELARQANAANVIRRAVRSKTKRDVYSDKLPLQRASDKIKAAIAAKEIRDTYTDALVNYNRPTLKLQAAIRRKPERESFQGYMKVIKDKEDLENLTNKLEANIVSKSLIDNLVEQAIRNEERKNVAATAIQKTVRGHKGRQQSEKEKIDKLVQLSLEAQERGQMKPLSPPAATELSSAMTVAEQNEAGLRKVRSDLGAKRAPYMTKKKKEKEEKELMKSLTPEERRMVQQQQQTQRITRAQALDAVLRKQQPGKTRTLDQIREELEDTQRAKGSGFGRRKQPKRRQAKTSQEDKQKNRLRLVAAQIEAGNTNPRLVLEVNDLYEKLYGIKNAYMLLKK